MPAPPFQSCCCWSVVGNPILLWIEKEQAEKRPVLQLSEMGYLTGRRGVWVSFPAPGTQSVDELITGTTHRTSPM